MNIPEAVSTPDLPSQIDAIYAAEGHSGVRKLHAGLAVEQTALKIVTDATRDTYTEFDGTPLADDVLRDFEEDLSLQHGVANAKLSIVGLWLERHSEV